MPWSGIEAEVVFVDDSTDATPDVIREVAASAALPVRLIHRAARTGGLGGAVVAGFAAAEADVCLVIDGDLQHPPEEIPALYERFQRGDVDVVVASRYAGGGTARGLSDRTRVLVSKVATALTKAMFPIRLRDVSDPMTGFFLRSPFVESATIKPRGFKILLEILARQNLRVAEVPFDFADRHAGESKASLRQGMHFITQLTALRFGKMSLFAVIGAIGAIVNLAIMWGLIQLDVDYIVAAIIAAETTIIGNFLLQERFVFHDMRDAASRGWLRFAKSFSFNNAEALIRIPILALLVETWHISAVLRRRDHARGRLRGALRVPLARRLRAAQARRGSEPRAPAGRGARLPGDVSGRALRIGCRGQRHPLILSRSGGRVRRAPCRS